MKNKKFKEDDHGIWEWKPTEHGNGYWSLIEDPELQKDRVPLVCPICGKFLMNWDTQFVYKCGACSDCYADFFQGREIPEEIKTIKDKIEWGKGIRDAREKNKLRNSEGKS